MNCFSTFSRAIFTRNCFSVLVPKAKTSFIKYGFSFSIIKQPIVLDSFPSKFQIHCFSSRTRKKLPNPTSPSVKLLDIDEPPPSIEPEVGGFFVVRKGDIVGVYKSFTDCQAQFGSSVCDPPVSVFKGHSLSKDTEEYLASVGLKNAMYTIKAADLRPDLFTSLMPCTFHDELKCEASGTDAKKKRSLEALVSENAGSIGSTSSSMDPLRKHVKLEDPTVPQALSPQSCYLEFDGASKGNPGKAGAGAVLRAHDGSVVCRLREGLGTATNNVAEYRAILLGLKYALQKGYTSIHVQGDSKLVCLQVQGSWKARNENMSELCKKVKKLKNQFLSFHISHVLRNLNSEADAQANLGVSLAAGQVQEVFE